MFKSKIKIPFEILISYLLVFIVPLFSLLFSLKYFKTKQFSNILWICCIIFGFTMYVYDPIYDSYRYMLQFYSINDLNNLDSLFDYFSKSGDIDIYQILTSYFVGLIVEDHRFYFAFLAIVYGFFYSRNIYLILNLKNVKPYLAFLFFCVFFSLQGIWYIEGARFWTASQIFIYLVVCYFFHQEKFGIKNKLLLILLPFIHISFLYPVLFFLIFSIRKFSIFVSRFIFIFFIFFLLVSFMKEFFPNINLSKLLFFLPSNSLYRVEYYTSQEYIQLYQSFEFTLFGKFFDILKQILSIALMSFLFFKRNFFKINKSIKLFFNFSFIFYVTSTFLGLIPVFDRFQYLGLYFLVICLYIYLYYYKSSFSIRIIIILLLFLSLNEILQSRPFISIDFLLPFLVF